MQSLVTGILAGRGGVAMAESILQHDSVQALDSDIPTWCKCGKCVVMDTQCCNKRHCTTSYRHFYNICLDHEVLIVAIHQRCDLCADVINYSPESYQKAAYRQYILWVYKKLGHGNHRVCPSCGVQIIRQWYPSPTGQYMGFRAN